MDSFEVLDKLEELAGISSNNLRLERVKILLDDQLFAWVAFLACNPFITFGIKGTKTLASGTAQFKVGDGAVFDFLDRLASRNLTGNAARDELDSILRMLSPSSGEVLWRILHKDLRCAVTSTILNKARPGFIPVFEVMLAHKFEEKRFVPLGMVAEPKKDGVRATCLVANGDVRFLSRTGKPFEAVRHLTEDVLELCRQAWSEACLRGSHAFCAYLNGSSRDDLRIVFDGEITSGSFLKTVGDVRRKSQKADDAVFEIFDVLPYDDFMKHEVVEKPFGYRRIILEEIFRLGRPSRRLSLIEQVKVETREDCYRVYTDWRTKGFEGAMIKSVDAPYAKKRSHAWMKMKAQESEDLRVVDAFEGEGKYVGKLGGLVVDFNGKQVRVGGGFSDEQRDVFWKLIQVDRHFPNVAGEILGHLIEVEYHEITQDGSLRHPRFVRFRSDKDSTLAA